MDFDLCSPSIADELEPADHRPPQDVEDRWDDPDTNDGIEWAAP